MLGHLGLGGVDIRQSIHGALQLTVAVSGGFKLSARIFREGSHIPDVFEQGLHLRKLRALLNQVFGIKREPLRRRILWNQDGGHQEER